MQGANLGLARRTRREEVSDHLFVYRRNRDKNKRRALRERRRRGHDGNLAPRRQSDVTGAWVWDVPPEVSRRRVGAAAVEWLGGYRLRVRFTDGEVGVLDMTEDVLWNPSPFMDFLLERPEEFPKVSISDDGAEAVTWPSGWDLCPEYLYHRCMYSDGLPFADEWWKLPPYGEVG